MELLLELIGQYILYGTAEVCTAKIAKNITKSRGPEKSKVSPISAAVIYAVIGYFGGLSSLLIFPKLLITNLWQEKRMAILNRLKYPFEALLRRKSGSRADQAQPLRPGHRQDRPWRRPVRLAALGLTFSPDIGMTP